MASSEATNDICFFHRRVAFLGFHTGVAGFLADIFIDCDVVRGFKDLASDVEAWAHLDADLGGGAVAFEAACEVFQGLNAVLGEDAVHVGGDAEGDGGGAACVDFVGIGGGALGELGVLDVDNPVHDAEHCIGLGGVLDADVEVHGEWYLFVNN